MVRVIFLIHLKRVGFGTGSQLTAWNEIRKAAAAVAQPQAPRAKGSQGEPWPGTHTAPLKRFIFSCSGSAPGQGTLGTRIKHPQELRTWLSTIQGQNLASPNWAVMKQCPGALKVPEGRQGKAHPLQEPGSPSQGMLLWATGEGAHGKAALPSPESARCLLQQKSGGKDGERET